MSVDKKVVLVTGGASGIGHATVNRLASDGAHLVVADRQVELSHEVVREVIQAGGSAEVCELDVAAEGAAAAAVQTIVAKHGRLDCAFNNAGITGPTVKLLDIEPQEWASVLAVNLTGVFSCVQAEIAQMVQQETGGSIVNTASICGLVALPHATAYNAAKHGVIGLTKSAAVEYGPKKIRVNAVCPGFIDTPMLAKGAGASQEILNGVVSQLPIRRIAGASEVADVVAWLLSEQSSYVTGVAMPIDGGWTAQ
ncbi:MAG: SDR family NAD(P)-dependent oxidoreductase [Pseudomonadales bacterium]|nr:SDR family NAD(P)-dependent oxidoreductase [Pseudomonadales bacterium]